MLLAQLSHTITEALRASRDVTVRPDGSMEAVLPMHGAVIEAIASGDEALAETTMSRLAGRALGDIEAILGQDGRPREHGPTPDRSTRSSPRSRPAPPIVENRR